MRLLSLPASVTSTLWALAVLGCLWLMGAGLLATFQIENTSASIAEVDRGQAMAGLAALLLTAAACYALTPRCPTGAGVLVALPVLTGLWVLGDETTALPLLSALVTFPAALAGVLWCLAARRS